MPQPKTKEQIEIERLWRFEGSDADFWSELMLVCGHQIDAASGAVLVKPKEDQGTAEPNHWNLLKVWPESEETKQRFSAQFGRLSGLAESQVELFEPEFETIEIVDHVRAAAIRMNLDTDDLDCVVVFLRYGEEDFFYPSARMVHLMANSPLIFGADPIASLAAEQKRKKVHHHTDHPLSTVVNLGLSINQETRFLSSAMVFCNELASRFEADQVSLGWKKGSYIKVLATNHARKIEGKMDSTRLLGTAMEECVDQDDEIVFPVAESARAIFRDHEMYARHSGAKYLVSIPIRDKHEAIGAVTLESVTPLDESDLDILRISTDLVAQRLGELKKRDRWFGARWCDGVVSLLRKIVGVEHTLLKVCLLSIAAVITFLAIFPWEYRVEAPFTLKADEVYQVPAPFEGYIERADVKIGDSVKAGETMVVLDSTELELHSSEMASTIERFLAEAKLARSESSLSELHIAVAKAQETKSAMAKVRLQIDMATIVAPMDSYVVEGALRERIGTPVSKGEPLLKLSKLDGIYPELQISEKDIHRINTDSVGKVAFAGRPEMKFDIAVEKIEPIAVAEKSGNILRVYGEFVEDEIVDWWRPGMSGVAKIDCGKKSLLWIFTHRAIDFLRLKLWF